MPTSKDTCLGAVCTDVPFIGFGAKKGLGDMKLRTKEAKVLRSEISFYVVSKLRKRIYFIT